MTNEEIFQTIYAEYAVREGALPYEELKTDNKEDYDVVVSMLDAAREDEVMEFEKWRIDNGYNIRNNGKYAIYYMGQGNHTLNELYKLYKNR